MANDDSLLSLARDLFQGYVAEPVALGANAALLNTPKYPLSGIEALVGEAGELVGLAEPKPISERYGHALSEYEGALTRAKEASPVLGTTAEIAGGLFSPLNKLKLFQKAYQAGGVPGVLSRMGIAGGTAAISNIGEDDTAGAVEDAAILSAGFDALGSLMGKAGQVAGKVLKRGMGLHKTDYSRVARKYGRSATKPDLNNAYNIVQKEVPLSKAELFGSSEDVLNKFHNNIQSTIDAREKMVTKIVGVADMARKGQPVTLDLDPVLNKLQTIEAGLHGADVENAFIDTADTMLKKLTALGGGNPSLSRIHQTKKLLNKTYKLDPAHIDARSSVTDSFRVTIEKEVDRLAASGLVPKSFAGTIKSANKQIRDLIELRNSVAAKIPGFEVDDALSAGQKLMHTTGSVGATGAGNLADALGGNKGVAMLGAIASGVDRIKRPVAAFVEKTATPLSALFQSGGVRQGLIAGVSPKETEPLEALAGYDFEPSDDATDQFLQSLGAGADDDVTNEFIKSLGSTPGPRASLDLRNLANIKVSEPENEMDINSIDGFEYDTEKKTEFSPEFKYFQKLAGEIVPHLQARESGGLKEPDKATSPKGAMGRLQIMPGTGKEIAKELGYESYDLRDPETNLEFGTHYLAKMLERWDGNIQLALASYNAGPEAVQKWVDRWGTDWNVISEGLKNKKMYKETREYVPWIMKRFA